MKEQLAADALDLFWQFVTERQKVWHRRVADGQQPPWTDDEILRRYRFTNVYRKLDPGTQYVIQHILMVEAPPQDKIFNVMLYRLIGRRETHDHIGFRHLDEFDAEEVEAQLKHRRDELDEAVFTGAYMVSGYQEMGSSDKVENVVTLFDELADEPQFFDEVLAAQSLEEAYDLINRRPGFGNFLSYQVVVDLLYPTTADGGGRILPFLPDDWTSPGPGAKKGLNTLVLEPDLVDWLDVMRWLRQHQRDEFARLGLEFPYITTKEGDCLELSLADIQNCLCEYHKYVKISRKTGRARRRFRDSEGRSGDELRAIYEGAPHIQIP
jgi:hypothetical protein